MIAVLPQAFRSWSNAKAIAALASIAFAVGIGSTTAIYTVVHAVLLAPLPYANGDRFVALYGARFSEPKQFSSHTVADPLHVVLSEAAVARYWGADDPLGGFGRFGGANGSRFQIVGVVGDVRNNGLGNPSVPEIYVPSAVASANPVEFVVRSPLSSAQLVPEMRQAVRSVDPTLAIHDVATMNDVVAGSMALERVGSLMTTFFALAALLMATLGVYGLVAYSVRQRTVEIGTRMALGADRRDVFSLVIRGAVKMAAGGIVFGAGGVAGAVWLVARFFALGDVGWLPFVLATAVTAGVAIAACWFPAWRATRLSPMVAIRDL